MLLPTKHCKLLADHIGCSSCIQAQPSCAFSVACPTFLQVPALLAVGLEGCWGLLLCCFVLPLTTLVKGSDGFPLDDAVAAARSIFSNRELGVAVYSSILSIAFFNFFGVSGKQKKSLGQECRCPDVLHVKVTAAAGTRVVLDDWSCLLHSTMPHPALLPGVHRYAGSAVAAVLLAYQRLLCAVTKSLSGASRATIDACRTLFIWLYALHAGWESFHLLQVVGFMVLISGTSLYNEILKSCLPGRSITAAAAKAAAAAAAKAAAAAAASAASVAANIGRPSRLGSMCATTGSCLAVLESRG
jgi:hypothetical protein